MSKKLFLGYKLRRLREQRKLSQAAAAAALEVSPSYLNQIENNQRPLTVPVLLRIGKVFDVDLSRLVEDDDARLVADLREAINDPQFGSGAIGLSELRNVANASPELARRVLTLYQSHRHLQERFQAMADPLPGNAEAGPHPMFPYESVRDFFYYCNNYFGPLDEEAERIHAREGFRPGDMQTSLIDYLRRRHDVRVTFTEEDDPRLMRAFDHERRTLALSGLLENSSRSFQLAHQVALLDCRDIIEAIVAEARLPSEDARSICRVGLANYFAGALIMPYGAFLEQARKVRHDVELLQSRFGTSFEQVCHRLSTLQRPGANGVPFYFVRVDMAGNVTKRHSATRFHFTRFGGTCPLWNVNEAFAHPGKILVQLARMPDGIAYICIARTVSKPGGAYLRPDRHFAIGLGCDISHASEVVYSAGLDLTSEQAAMPIGVNCRVCERTNCQHRAFPPVGSHITVDENNRSFVPYLFA